MPYTITIMRLHANDGRGYRANTIIHGCVTHLLPPVTPRLNHSGPNHTADRLFRE